MCGTDPEVRRVTSFAPLNSEGRKQEALHGNGVESPLGRAVLFFSLPLCLIKCSAETVQCRNSAENRASASGPTPLSGAETGNNPYSYCCLHHARRWVSAQPSLMFLGGVNDFHPHFTASLECLVSEPLTL